jgi:hypothetical protein
MVVVDGLYGLQLERRLTVDIDIDITRLGLGFAYVRTPEGWQVIDARGAYLVRIAVDDDGTARLLGRDGQLWP